jgi:hypothetical protein
MKVQTLLAKQALSEPRLYDSNLPACTQFNFSDKATGKALGDEAE